MRCPYCEHLDSRVTDSRDTGQGIRRRRECLRCGLRFTTYERVQTTFLQVIKRDGRREDFDREKLATGIRKACAKRPISVETIEKLVDEVEGELQGLGRTEVPSSRIGELVMQRLKGLDSVAYIRFASVYRAFDDIEGFLQEIEALLKAREARPPRDQLPLLSLEDTPKGRRGRRPSMFKAGALSPKTPQSPGNFTGPRLPEEV